MRPSRLQVLKERLMSLTRCGRMESRLRFSRTDGKGSLGEVLIPCFLIIARTSSELVGAKEESEEEGVEEEGEVEREVELREGEVGE